jgi:predicted nucleic acid-binding protein
VTGLALLDASAFWRLTSPRLGEQRRQDVAGRIARGLVAASTPLLLETRAGRQLPGADAAELPLLWITDRSERRAADLQLQLRAAHQHLGVPPMDYLIAAVAEDHGAAILHYDADFERIAAHTDLAVVTEALAPLGTLP